MISAPSLTQPGFHTGANILGGKAMVFLKTIAVGGEAPPSPEEEAKPDDETKDLRP